MEEKKETEKTKKEDERKPVLPYCCMDCKERFKTYGEYSLHLKEVHGI